MCWCCEHLTEVCQNMLTFHIIATREACAVVGSGLFLNPSKRFSSRRRSLWQLYILISDTMGAPTCGPQEFRLRSSPLLPRFSRLDQHIRGGLQLRRLQSNPVGSFIDLCDAPSL